MRKLFDSGLILAAGIAVLFSLSTAKYDGYLGAANLDPDVMERSFHQMVYSGFVISFSNILLFLLIMTAIIFLYSHGVLPAFIDYTRRGIKQKRKIVKLRKRLIGNRVSPEIEKRAKSAFNKSATCLFFAFLYVLSLAYFEHQGRQDFMKIRHNYKNGSINGLETVHVKGVNKSLVYLACGAQNCAAIDPKSGSIYYFPESDGFYFKVNPVKK